MQASGNISMGIEWERGRTGKATAGELPPANKATCLGVRTFAKGDTTSTFHIYRYGIASKHLKCPISKPNPLFFQQQPVQRAGCGQLSEQRHRLGLGRGQGFPLWESWSQSGPRSPEPRAHQDCSHWGR